MAKKSATFGLQFCAINIGSLPPLSGFAEGDAMTIAYDGDDFEKQEGSDGYVIYIRKHNSVASLMFRLQQGHYLITLLRQLHEASLAADGVMYSFNATNLKSQDEVASGRILFKKHADMKWGDSANPLEFTAHLQVDKIVGGSATEA